jgi:hypothetical protein
MKHLFSSIAASLLVAAVVGVASPAFASPAQPQCGDDKKGDTKDDKSDGQPKPKPPAFR